MTRTARSRARTTLLRSSLGVFAAGAAVAALLWFAQRHGALNAPSTVLQAARWVALAGLIGYALARRSLTTWILVSMAVGAEVGHDFPAFAVKLQVVSLIFFLEECRL